MQKTPPITITCPTCGITKTISLPKDGKAHKICACLRYFQVHKMKNKPSKKEKEIKIRYFFDPTKND